MCSFYIYLKRKFFIDNHIMYHIFVKKSDLMPIYDMNCSPIVSDSSKMDENPWHKSWAPLLNHLYSYLWQILNWILQTLVRSNCRLFASVVTTELGLLIFAVLLGCILMKLSRLTLKVLKCMMIFINNYFQDTKAASILAKQEHILNQHLQTLQNVIDNKKNMNFSYFSDDKLSEVPSNNTLIRFHLQVIRLLQTCYHAEMQYEKLIDDILTSQNLFNNWHNIYSLSLKHPDRLQGKRNRGREFWPFIEICSCSELQSPINICRQRVENKHFAPLTFINTYDENGCAYLTNANQTAAVMLEGRTPFLEGGPLRGSYKFAQLHFHWSLDDTAGSEHTLDGMPFSMECHSVYIHIRCETINEALDCENGIAVVGNFLQVSDIENKNFSPISNNLRNIQQYDSVIEIPSNCLSFLKCNGQYGYYTYPGSLTTPLLSKTVTWILYPDPIAVSSSQMCGFRNLLDSNAQPIQKNCRSVQEINNREIFFAV